MMKHYWGFLGSCLKYFGMHGPGLGIGKGASENPEVSNQISLAFPELRTVSFVETISSRVIEIFAQFRLPQLTSFMRFNHQDKKNLEWILRINKLLKMNAPLLQEEHYLKVPEEETGGMEVKRTRPRTARKDERQIQKFKFQDYAHCTSN